MHGACGLAMPRTRLELVHPCGRGILSPLRLPVPPPGRAGTKAIGCAPREPRTTRPPPRIGAAAGRSSLFAPGRRLVRRRWRIAALRNRWAARSAHSVGWRVVASRGAGWVARRWTIRRYAPRRWAGALTASAPAARLALEESQNPLLHADVLGALVRVQERGEFLLLFV